MFKSSLASSTQIIENNVTSRPTAEEIDFKTAGLTGRIGAACPTMCYAEFKFREGKTRDKHAMKLGNFYILLQIRLRLRGRDSG